MRSKPTSTLTHAEVAPGAAQRYRTVLRAPEVGRLLLCAYAGTVSVGMNVLAILLFTQDATGSFAAGGLTAGCYSLGRALGTPIQGRLIDRRRAAPVLTVLTALHAPAVGGLIAAGWLGAALALLGLMALAIGITHPSLLSVLRSLWPTVFAARPALLRTAYALDAVLVDVVFVSGPVFVALLASAISPASAVLASGLLVLLGVAGFNTAAAVRDLPAIGGGPRSMPGPLKVPALRVIIATTLPLGFSVGVIEVALPAFAASHGAPSLGGVLIACWAAGSVAGGVLYGGIERGSPLRSYLVLLWLIGPGVALMVMATSTATIIPLAVLAGLGFAPLMAAANELISVHAPAEAMAEAYTWPVTALVAGLGVGAIVAGVITEAASWRAALLLGAAAGVLGAAVATRWRALLVWPGSPGRRGQMR